MSTAKLLNQLIQNLEKSGDLIANKMNNRDWLLKCIMVQIANNKLKNNDLNFPEDLKWCSDVSVSWFGLKRIFPQTIPMIVGNIQMKNQLFNPFKTNYINLDKDCSFLCSFTFDSYRLDFTKDVLKLMNIVYDSQKSGEIPNFPDRLACYKLSNNDYNNFDVEETKFIIKKGIFNPMYNSLYNNKIIGEKEEINWIINHYESIIQKLEIKIFTWENLIESIENTESKMELNEFYKNILLNA